MNANEPHEPKPQAADAPEAGASPDAAAVKPKRRRAAKPASTGETPQDPSPTDAVPVAAAAASPSPSVADLPVEPVRAARAPRRKRVAVAAEGDAAGPPEASREVRTEPAAAAVAAPVISPVAPEGRQPTPPSDESQASRPTGSAPDGAPEAGPIADGTAPPAREGNRRNRNRRRKRGDRGDRAERAGLAPLGTTTDGSPLPEGVEPPAESTVLLEPTDPNELFAEVLSGAFDAEPSLEAAAPVNAEPPKRVLAPEPDAPKLHKVLAQSGIGSRRDMEQWMQEGRVTVNGEPAHTGQRISFGDRIAVDGKPVKVRIAPPPPRVLAYHKPAGEVVTHDDPQHRPTVFRRLPRLQQGKWQSVGRLDINTEGLLLFTNSGELANQLMHPRFGVEREYAVRSLGTLDPEQRARLIEGVEIDGQRCGFKSIEDGGGEGVNHWYRVVITEGRNREVRKLFEAVGHAVSRLIRIRYGCVVLPRGLKRGVWVDMPEPDVRALRRLTGTERPRDDDADGGPRGKRGRRGGGKNRDGRPDRSPDRAAERGPRPDRGPRPERAPRADGEGPMNIPNPLQQTYDKRAIQQARSARRELGEDDPIPNPLQQTYDKRALQRDRMPMRDVPEDGPIPNPLQQTYDRRFVQKGPGGGGGGGGGGRGGRAGGGRGGPGGGGGGMRQPDPMQTAVGYIGADAFRGKGGRGGKGGGRGNKGGGGAGGGGGGRGPGGRNR